MIDRWINDANVHELARLLCEPTRQPGDPGFCPECYIEAERLASRGVLAIDALTDAQVDSIPSYDDWFGDRRHPEYDADFRARRRAALRRLATGEPDEPR